MRQFQSSNITLVEEDAGELTLYVSDDTVPLACQELAILPEEIDRLMDVFMQYNVKK